MAEIQKGDTREIPLANGVFPFDDVTEAANLNLLCMSFFPLFLKMQAQV